VGATGSRALPENEEQEETDRRSAQAGGTDRQPFGQAAASPIADEEKESDEQRKGCAWEKGQDKPYAQLNRLAPFPDVWCHDRVGCIVENVPLVRKEANQGQAEQEQAGDEP
jgi:hypothetical protein